MIDPNDRRVTIDAFQVCDGIRDCVKRCAENGVDSQECEDDEDPAKCSSCPRKDGYPKRSDSEIWSATHLCYHNETKLPRCSVPCNGEEECSGQNPNLVRYRLFPVSDLKYRSLLPHCLNESLVTTFLSNGVGVLHSRWIG